MQGSMELSAGRRGLSLSFREKTVELPIFRQFWGGLLEAQRVFKNPRISDVRFSGLPS